MACKPYGRCGGEYHGGYYRIVWGQPGAWHIWLDVADYAQANGHDYTVHCQMVADVRALLVRLQTGQPAGSTENPTYRA